MKELSFYRLFSKLIILEILIYTVAVIFDFGIVFYYYAHIIIYCIAYTFFALKEYKDSKDEK